MAENNQRTPPIYKSLIVEIRQRVQSVNVFVLLQGPAAGVGIILKENGFQLNNVPGHDGTVEEVVDIPLNNLSIVTDSLSTVRRSDDFISFRFNTNNPSGMGGFKRELLQAGAGPSFVSSNSTAAVHFERGKRYSLECLNCFQKLSSNLIFNRVLPLPSELMDSSDFFCHGSIKCNTNPKITDLFYSKYYADLHMDIMKKGIIKEEKYFICKRCFCYLGSIVRSQSVETKKVSDTLRVWYHTVGFRLDDNRLYKTVVLDDALSMFKDLFSSVPVNSLKVMFNCDGAREGTDYLLVWVIEKELNVIIDVPICDLKVNRKVAKVLYRFEAKDALSGEVDKWSKDLYVQNVMISKPMINAVVRYLCKFNKLMPEHYRKNDQFFFSYLLIYDF